MNSDKNQDIEKQFGNINVHYWHKDSKEEIQFSLEIYYKDSLIYEQTTEKIDAEKILETTNNLSIGAKTKYLGDFVSSAQYFNAEMKKYLTKDSDNTINNLYLLLKYKFAEIGTCLLNAINTERNNTHRSQETEEVHTGDPIHQNDHRPEYIDKLIEMGVIMPDGQRVVKSLNDVALEMQKLNIQPTTRILYNLFLKSDGMKYSLKACEKAVSYANSE